MLPSPCTGGGGKMAMMDSWMAANSPFSWAAMAPADSEGSRRSSKGFRVTKTMPLLGLLVKPLMDRPGKATVLSTPGCLRAMADMRRMTSSLRSRVAASGNWAKATRYCLSWGGTKPVGVFTRPRPVRPSSTT